MIRINSECVGWRDNPQLHSLTEALYIQPSNAAKFHTSLVILHWLNLVLLVGIYACIELRVEFPRGSDTHKLLEYCLLYTSRCV